MGHFNGLASFVSTVSTTVNILLLLTLHYCTSDSDTNYSQRTYSQSFYDTKFTTDSVPGVTPDFTEVTTAPPCDCEEKIRLILEQLKALREEVKRAKRGRSDDVGLTVTPNFPPADIGVENLVRAVATGNEALARHSLGSLPVEYHRSPERILLEASRIVGPDIMSFLSLFKFLTAYEAVESIIDFAVELLHLQEESGELKYLETLKENVNALTEVLQSFARPAPRESEITLITSLVSNLVEAIPEGDDAEWAEVEKWMGKEFFSDFQNLTRADILGIVLRSFDNKRTVLSASQLHYVERRYYDCADTQGSLHPSFGGEFHFNFSLCNEKLASSAFVPQSIGENIGRKILEENLVRADAVVEHYISSVLRDYPILDEHGRLSRPYRYMVHDDNLWLRFVLDSTFQAVDSGRLQCDHYCVEQILRSLHPLHSGLSKYSHLTEHVVQNVTKQYRETPQDIYPILGHYLARLPYSLQKLGVESLATVVGSSPMPLPAEQKIILAWNLAKFGLEDHIFWREIPEQMKLLTHLTIRTTVQWGVLVANETYRIYSKNDSRLRLGLHVEGQAEKSGWEVEADLVGKHMRLNFFSVDDTTGDVRRLHGGSKLELRHESPSEERSVDSEFTVYFADPREAAFQLRFVAEKGLMSHVCVTRSKEDEAPAELYECKGTASDELANFVLERNRKTITRDLVLEQL